MKSLNFPFQMKMEKWSVFQDSCFSKIKVVLVQIMGTWCPNCLDETKYYVDYLKNNPNSDLAVIALAFEYAKTEEKAWKGIERLKDRVGVDIPNTIGTSGQFIVKRKPMKNCQC